MAMPGDRWPTLSPEFVAQAQAQAAAAQRAQNAWTPPDGVVIDGEWEDVSETRAIPPPVPERQP